MTLGCPECGALLELPPLSRPSIALCPTCALPLERTAGRSLQAALACSLATFVLLIPANLAPLLSVHAFGAERSEVLVSGLVFMWRHGWVVMALLLGAFGIVLPIVRFGGLTVVLAAVLLNVQATWLGPLYRWVMQMDIWAMSDVFLVAFFIGVSRVSQHLTAHIGYGGYCFIVAALLTMLTRAVLDRRTLWRAIAPTREIAPGAAAISCTVCDLAVPAEAAGEPCPRCGLVLRSRKPDAIPRAAALSLAALAFYFPANIVPMTVSMQLHHPVKRRIINGVIELFQAGLWPLGCVIFCTSIAIPLLKIVGMGWFLLSTRRCSQERLRLKTRLHRFIDELGRWSNVDVFTLAIFIPLIRFGDLASSRAAPGSMAFTLVVFLTMIASRVFDPRLMWDAAERGAR